MGDASTESPLSPAAPSAEWVLGEMERLGHMVFEDRRGFDLNIVGVRSTDDRDSDRFNDWITVGYLAQGGQWCHFAFPATTDPGAHYRRNPANPAGTAIMLGAFLIHGLKPGPLLFMQQPVLVYSIFVGMFLANLSIIILAKLFIRYFSKVIELPGLTTTCCAETFR